MPKNNTFIVTNSASRQKGLSLYFPNQSNSATILIQWRLTLAMAIKINSIKFSLALYLSVLTACAPKSDSVLQGLEQFNPSQITPEQQNLVLKSMGESWIYGNGLGDTLLAAGTVFLFPPSALYFLGNAALDLSGYEPIRISNALPEAPKESWDKLYDGVTAGPGKLSAALAGREFITRERAKEIVKQSISVNQTTTK